MPNQSRFKKLIQSKSFLLWSITFVVLVITFIFQPKAFNFGNTARLLSILSYGGIFLCAVSVLLISGGLDFSLAAMATAASLFFSELLRMFPALPWPVAALSALLFGACAGGINAFFSQGLNLMPFICTIGMSSVWSGLSSWYTRGTTLPIRNAAFNKLSTYYIGKTPIPWLFVLMLVLVVIYSVILMRTRFGRSVLMAGGNPTAARLAGLNPKKIKSILFINAGVMATLGGLVWASQQKMASPTGLILASPDMSALTSSILGGVAFAGGSGSLGGAFAGVILVNVLLYALQVLGLPTWLITFINGSLLVVALTIDTFNMRRRMKKLGLAAGGSGMVMPGVSR